MITASEDDIKQVSSLFDLMTSTKYHKAKKELFVKEVRQLTESASMLLTFLAWFSLFNPRFKFISASRFYFLPTTETNEVTFDDFVALVRHYENRRITRSKEADLCKFLARCDQFHKTFYLNILSREFAKPFPMMELQAELDLDQFSTDVLYTPAEPLETGLDQLVYPVTVRAIPRGSMQLVALVKEARGTYFYFVKDKLHRTKVPKELLRDSIYTTTPRFVLLGYLSEEGVLYPADIFETLSEFKRYYQRGEPRVPKVDWLNQFLAENLTTCIDTGKVATVRSESDWIDTLKSTVGDARHSKLIIYNSEPLRRGEVFYIDIRAAHGVISSMSTNGGAPTGFNVWFNGKLQECTYDFSGRENALLNNISLVRNKRLDFYYIKIKEERYLIGKSIGWRDNTWRSYRLRGTPIMIEKCVFCGRTEHPHESRGICKSCYHTLFRVFPLMDPDTWVPATPQKIKTRETTCWEPSLLNAVDLQHQGYLIKANEKGEWGFFSDSAAMEKYLYFTEGLTDE